MTTGREAVTRSAAGMGAATVVSRGFGFARALLIAAVLGTTYLGNTFQSSNSVSNVVFELVAAGALSAVLVPTFVSLFDAGEHREAERRARVLLGYAVVWLGALSILGMLGSPWIAHALSAGVRDPAIRSQQEDLATFFLIFFIPQIVFYAFGAVATAILYAQRRLVITALAPIGNTVMMIIALGVFLVLRGGAAPSLDLTMAEKLTLALGGTLGVIAFVGVPMVAVWRGGVRLVPKFTRRDPAVHRMLRLSGWAIFQNAGVGILLGTALIVGNAVAGGVVAYQTAFVFFLAPYAVLAQPVQTAILPDLSLEAASGNLPAFAASIRWALSSLSSLVVPVSFALVVLSPLIMRVAIFGKATDPDLYAVALASLAIGLVPYSAFLLIARSYYALDNSRTPAVVALVTACLGAGLMVVLGAPFHGTWRVAALGLGHSVAYLLGTIALLVHLARKADAPVLPERGWRPFVAALVAGAVMAAGVWFVDPHGRIAAIVVGVGLTALGGAIYLGLMRTFGVQVRLRRGLQT